MVTLSLPQHVEELRIAGREEPSKLVEALEKQVELADHIFPIGGGDIGPDLRVRLRQC